MKISLGAKLYIWAVISFAAFLIYFILQRFSIELGPHFLQALVVFAFLSFLAQVYEVELVYGRHTSTSVAIFLAAVLLGGPLLAIGVMFVSTLIAEIFLRWWSLRLSIADFLYRVGFNIGQIVLSTFGASIAFTWLGGQPLLMAATNQESDLSFSWITIPAVGAFLTYSVVNTALVSGVLSLVEKTNFVYHFRFNVKYLLVQILSLAVLGILLAITYKQNPWNLLLVLIPLGLVHLSLRNYMKLRYEAHKTFERMAKLLRERDFYTSEHSNEVAELAERIALKLKLHPDQIEKIKAAAAIHDLGKVIVPDEILQKPGPLTNKEWEIIKKHPDTGADLLKGLEMYGEEVADIVRYGHEHWDGSGYPKTLKGDEIPLGARIIAAADAYNALITDRPYRKALSHEEAIQEIREMSGTVLDPKVVDALLDILKEERKPQPSPTTKATTA